MNKELWNVFAQKYCLTAQQLEQFKNYLQLLVEWNKKINLTAITDSTEIIAYHFEDALKLENFLDLAASKMIIDVGTGGGIPGIPLKIKYPHLQVVLVEVIQKKVDFLNLVIKELGLEGIEVCLLDWRTFLRKTDYPADIVVARASLRPDELTRMFKPSSAYKNATLIYWASSEWKLPDREAQFLVRQEKYAVGERKRKYLFFEKNQS